MKQTKKGGAGKAIAIGAGIAAIGAGAYYLLGPDGKKNQKKVHAWAVKMEKEADKKIKAIKNASEPVYHNLVDSLTEAYAKEYKEHAPEIKAFSKALKTKWKAVSKSAKPVVKKAKAAAKKVVKMAAKPKAKAKKKAKK